jgi:hypothetical protein
VSQVQITDERSHQTGFAYAGGQGKTEGRKFALKVRYRGEFALDGRQQGGGIRPLAWRGDLGNPMEDFERSALRRPQAQAA